MQHAISVVEVPIWYNVNRLWAGNNFSFKEQCQSIQISIITYSDYRFIQEQNKRPIIYSFQSRTPCYKKCYLVLMSLIGHEMSKLYNGLKQVTWHKTILNIESHQLKAFYKLFNAETNVQQKHYI